jgi:hypothetical protein
VKFNILQFERTTYVNKRVSKPKGQSRMDDPETPATLGSQDEGKQKQAKNTTQHRDIRKMIFSVSTSTLYNRYLLEGYVKKIFSYICRQL